MSLGPSASAPLATRLHEVAPPRQDELLRGAVVGRFVVLDVVGRGGMGVVYSAYDPDLDRKIALKLVRPGRAEAAAREALLREAQAIARLAHPNVVTIHDLGSHGDRVFLAMELIDGRTLRAWLGETPRCVREILAVFLEAGRGLAAAHAAGVFHRDFKPENVLIDREGRARVVDFGIADRAAMPRPELLDLPNATRGALGTLGLTAEGVRAAGGTLPYMAPELLRGQNGDARSDQFAFAVSLYEALYGERPFVADSLPDLALAIAQGDVRDAPANPPHGRRVPSWLRALLLRALATESHERFPSMNELLAALGQDPEAARRKKLALAAMTITLLGLGLGARQLWVARNRECRGGELEIAKVWNAERKTALRRAFEGTRLPFANAAAAGGERARDGYALAWTTMLRDACEATRRRGEQSEALLDRRMICLDQRLRDFSAFAEQLAQIDATSAAVVEKAASAVADLPALSTCADSAALTARVPPPTDATARAAVQEIGASIASARAQGAAGRFRQGLTTAEQAVQATGRIDYPPIRAEALVVRGALETQTDAFDAARSTLRDAFWTAESGADDPVKARAATELLRLERLQARIDSAEEWARFAAAALARLGPEPELRARYLQELGSLREVQGRYRDAFEPLREAVALRRAGRPFGREGAEVAEALAALGTVLHRDGELEEARKAYEESLTIVRRELGPDHPEFAAMTQRMGNLLFDQGRYEESITYGRRALATRERLLGPEHHLVANSLNSLANALNQLRRTDEAIPTYERALTIQRKTLGPDSPVLASTVNNLGNAFLFEKKYSAAEACFREAYAIRLRAFGPDHPSIAKAIHNLGNLFEVSGRPTLALEQYRRSLALSERLLDPSHPTVLEDLISIGDLERRQGRAQIALETLEKALTRLDPKNGNDEIAGRVRFALAQALVAAGGDGARAKQLAEAARVDFERLGGDAESFRREVEAWLAQFQQR